MRASWVPTNGPNEQLKGVLTSLDKTSAKKYSKSNRYKMIQTDTIQAVKC